MTQTINSNLQVISALKANYPVLERGCNPRRHVKVVLMNPFAIDTMTEDPLPMLVLLINSILFRIALRSTARRADTLFLAAGTNRNLMFLPLLDDSAVLVLTGGLCMPWQYLYRKDDVSYICISSKRSKSPLITLWRQCYSRRE